MLTIGFSSLMCTEVLELVATGCWFSGSFSDDESDDDLDDEYIPRDQ